MDTPVSGRSKGKATPLAEGIQHLCRAVSRFLKSFCKTLVSAPAKGCGQGLSVTLLMR